MRPSRVAVAALTLLIGGVAALGATLNGVSTLTTTAAWTDQTDASAVVTAGEWQTPANGTCVAYTYDGSEIDGCAVRDIRYEGWGETGSRTRNYYVSFDAPSGARSISFDVDLETATGSDSDSEAWSWATSGVASGAQFTASDGWTCDQLPRVQGLGADWHTSTIYFQVVENREGSDTLCS